MHRDNTANSLDELMKELPQNVQFQSRLQIEISQRIESLMRERGLTKKQFADAMGRRPSEVTKWLSGQHNFTIASITKLSLFFGEPIIQVVK